MKPPTTKTAALLHKLAMAHEDVEQGVACEGTGLEALTYNANKKAFLFVHWDDGQFTLRLKLGPSLKEAQELAKKHPHGFQAGSGGWAKIIFPEKEPAPTKLLGKWIAESYASTKSAGKKARKA